MSAALVLTLEEGALPRVRLQADGPVELLGLLQYLTRERTTPEVATAIDAAVYEHGCRR